MQTQDHAVRFAHIACCAATRAQASCYARLLCLLPHLRWLCGELLAHRNNAWRFMQRHQLAMKAAQVVDNALPGGVE
jgi:hypothetical protein